MRKVQVLYSDKYGGRDNFCRLLSDEFKLRIVSMGDTLRTEIKLESDLGLKIKSHLENGELLPVELVNSLLKKEIESDENNILIVNYPSTENLFFGFLDLIELMSIKIEKVWLLKLINLEYITQQELINLGEIYTAKYGITKDTLFEEIRVKQESLSKIIKLWRIDFNVRIVPVDYEKGGDLLNYFMEKIKRG